MKAPRCPFNEIVGKIKVLSMETHSELPAEELSDRLRGFFGTDGLGLDVMVDRPGRLRFEGRGGHVSATLFPEEDRTLLRIVTSNWAVQVKKFIAELP